MAATAPTTPTSPRQCVGAKLAGEQLTPPHEAALSEFNRYKASPDGYDKICRVCWSTYEKTRRARKAAAAEQAERAPGVAQAAEEARRHEAAAKTARQPATLIASGAKAPREYADQLALQAARGKAPGYATEEIGGVIYALPEAPEVVGTPEGQAALAACNGARATERRRREAERKREERARKKKAAAEAAQA